MVEYEVGIEFDTSIAGTWLPWLEAHIGQMLALPGFLHAEVWRIGDPAPPGGRTALCVRYRLASAAALDRYLAEFAPAMRAEGLQRFATQVSFARRVLHPWPRPLAAEDAAAGGGA
jgi:hypothetical protein